MLVIFPHFQLVNLYVHTLNWFIWFHEFFFGLHFFKFSSHHCVPCKAVNVLKDQNLIATYCIKWNFHHEFKLYVVCPFDTHQTIWVRDRMHSERKAKLIETWDYAIMWIISKKKKSCTSRRRGDVQFVWFYKVETTLS